MSRILIIGWNNISFLVFYYRKKTEQVKLYVCLWLSQGPVPFLHSYWSAGVGVEKTLSSKVVFTKTLRFTYPAGFTLQNQLTSHKLYHLRGRLSWGVVLHGVLDLWEHDPVEHVGQEAQRSPVSWDWWRGLRSLQWIVCFVPGYSGLGTIGWPTSRQQSKQYSNNQKLQETTINYYYRIFNNNCYTYPQVVGR